MTQDRSLTTNHHAPKRHARDRLDKLDALIVSSLRSPIHRQDFAGIVRELDEHRTRYDHLERFGKLYDIAYRVAPYPSKKPMTPEPNVRLTGEETVFYALLTYAVAYQYYHHYAALRNSQRQQQAKLWMFCAREAVSNRLDDSLDIAFIDDHYQRELNRLREAMPDMFKELERSLTPKPTPMRRRRFRWRRAVRRRAKSP